MKRYFLIILAIFLWVFSSFSQIQISGTITSSEDGLGIPGAAAYVKGTTIGTTADIDGNYKISVPESAKILVFSFVGMKTQEIEINGQTTINVVLGTDIFKLEEVVVSGVASATPKRKLSVSVVKVGSEELEKVPATSAATALQGKVAGLTIVNNPNPGQSAGIRLRSSTQIFGVQGPLIIIDGIMLDGELADINPDDIEDFEVVKGAAASALYGSRAGNGVLSIHTKRGKLAAETTFEIKVRNEYGVSQLAHEIKLAEHHPYLLADDYKQPGYTKYANVTYPEGYAGGENSKIKGTRMLDYDHYADNPYSFVIDPQKEIFLDGAYYTNFASITGNSSKLSAMISFENNHNSGIVFNKKGVNRQSVRVNADMQVYDWLKVSSSTNISESKLDIPEEGSSSAFYGLLFMNPDVNLDMEAVLSDSSYLKKYFYKPDHWSLSRNPKHTLYYEDLRNERNNILQNLNAKVNLSKWLVADLDYSFEKRFNENSLYVPVGFKSADPQKFNGSFFIQNQMGLSQTFTSTLNFNQVFGQFTTKGKLSYMFEKSNMKTILAGGDSLISSSGRTLDAVSLRKTISSSEFLTKARNYFGILDFDYKDRYIFSLLYRLDGSSLFGANNRWNPYYRYSIAYRLSEDFKINSIQELKLKFAEGTSGQRPGFDYQYETFGVNNGQYVPFSSGNKDLKPSETKEREYGLNIQFLDRFEAEVNITESETKGAFIPAPMLASTGFPIQWQNAATLSGSTFEVSLGSQVLKNSQWEWNINLTFDHVAQKVTKLDVKAFSTGPHDWFYIKEGDDLGIMYGHDWVRNLDQMKRQLPKDKKIENYKVNSDGYVIEKVTEGTKNEKPILLESNGAKANVKIADLNPDFNMSLNTTLTWRNISLSMLWSWKQGGEIYNYTRQYLYLDKRHGDLDQFGKDAYQKKAIDYYMTFYDGSSPNSYFVEDGTYLKLRECAVNIELNKMLSKTKFKFVKGAKLGILGRNLLTFTKYTGWDPEVATGSDLTTYSFDDFGYPNYRSYTVSLELRF